MGWTFRSDEGKRNTERILGGNPIDKRHLKDQDVDRIMTLKWVLGKHVVTRDDGWNCLSVVFVS